MFGFRGEFHRFLDMAKPPLAKHIKLVQANVFSNEHIHLHRREAFRCHDDGSVIGDGLFR